MRTLINYIRTCFCKHEWELLEKTSVYSNDYFHDGHELKCEHVQKGTKWTYRCNKCGYMYTYKNY